MGQTDIPLNEEGRSQAQSLHKIMHNQNITQIFHSPLQRAQETALIINEGLNVPMHPLDDLKEWQWGMLEGKMTEEIKEKTLLEWSKDHHALKAESEAAFLSRIATGLSHVLQNDEPSLIVSHGGVYWGLCQILNCTYETLDNCRPLLFKPVVLDESPSGYEWNVEWASPT